MVESFTIRTRAAFREASALMNAWCSIRRSGRGHGRSVYDDGRSGPRAAKRFFEYFAVRSKPNTLELQ